jgi:hypothetical protein
MTLPLFSPLVESHQMHRNFNSVYRDPNYEAERRIVMGWAEGFLDRDGKFVKEFQTTFNSGFWELYLHAVFRELGCTCDFSKHAPDFVLEREGYGFCAEAGIASNADGFAPEWDMLSAVQSAEAPDPKAFLELATIRLANTITAKHRKFIEKYNKLDWVKNKPFVLCVAPFEQPFFFDQNDHALRRVLYGFDQPLYKDYDGKRILLGEARTESVTKIGGATVPLGLFTRPDMKEISAVVFSSTATWSKVRALAGAGSGDGIVIFHTVRFAEDDLVPRRKSILRPQYTESLLDGLHLCVNPFAERPLDPAIFNVADVCVHQYDPTTGSYWPFAPDNFLIHRWTHFLKPKKDAATRNETTLLPREYKRHTVQPWPDGELIRVGGGSLVFDDNYMAHYRGWTSARQSSSPLW